MQSQLYRFTFSIAIDKVNILNLLKSNQVNFKNKQRSQQLQLLNIKLKNNVEYYTKFLHYSNKTHLYCSQFSRAVILSTLQIQRKAFIFRQIKNALKNKKKTFTPLSATKIVQNLCLFEFQGDQFVLLNQLADYFQQNKIIFTEKLKNRFQLAYKDIMVNKALGPVKFRSIDFSQQYTQKERKIKQLESFYKQIDKNCIAYYRKGFFQINLSGMHLKIFSYRNKMKRQSFDDLYASIKTIKNVKNIALLQKQSLQLGYGQMKQNQNFQFIKQFKQRLQSSCQQGVVKLFEFQIQKVIQHCTKNYKLKHLQQIFGYLSILNFYSYFQYLHFFKEKSIAIKNPIYLNEESDTNFTYKYLAYQASLLQIFKRNLGKIDKRVQNGVFLVHQQDLNDFQQFLKKMIENQKQRTSKIQTKIQSEEQTVEKRALLKTLFQYNQLQAKYWKIMTPL